MTRAEAIARLRPLTHVGGVLWDVEDGRALEVILDALDRIDGVAADLTARGEAAFGRYMGARGAPSQALWQGKADAFIEASGSIKSALQGGR